MAKVDNIKKLNSVEVSKTSVTITDLVIKDEDFVQYVANADNKEQAVLEVISLGVQTLNTLKNSIEKDFTKQVFKEMSESMDKTLDTTLTSIKDEFNHFFDDEDGAFIKELNDSSSELSQKLKDEFDNFLDPGKTESAISKIKEVLSEAKEQSKLSFEEALNPSIESSKIYELKTQLVDTFSKKIDEISSQVNDLTTALGIEDKTKELKEKSTQKGVEFEEVVQAKLVEVCPNDFVQRVSSEQGTIDSDKGDHVIEISNPSDEKVNIVIESKAGSNFDSTTKIKTYMDLAMKNRDSQIGIMVFDNVSRYKELSSSPFFMVDENKIAVVLDKDNTDDDTALRVACVFARQLALQISTTSSSREKVDVSSIKSELETIYGSISNLRAIRIANSKAKEQIERANGLLEEKQRTIIDNIDNIFEIISATNDEKGKKND